MRNTESTASRLPIGGGLLCRAIERAGATRTSTAGAAIAGDAVATFASAVAVTSCDDGEHIFV